MKPHIRPGATEIWVCARYFSSHTSLMSCDRFSGWIIMLWVRAHTQHLSTNYIPLFHKRNLRYLKRCACLMLIEHFFWELVVGRFVPSCGLNLHFNGQVLTVINHIWICSIKFNSLCKYCRKKAIKHSFHMVIERVHVHMLNKLFQLNFIKNFSLIKHGHFSFICHVEIEFFFGL